MIHIVLTILKIIGIVILVLLGILVSLLLIVLFVPLRYRITVKKEEEPLSADISVSWFLRMVRLHCRYCEKKAEATVRILRFTLKSFSFPSGEKSSGKKDEKTAGEAAGAEIPEPVEVSSGSVANKGPEEKSGEGGDAPSGKESGEDAGKAASEESGEVGDAPAGEESGEAGGEPAGEKSGDEGREKAADKSPGRDEKKNRTGPEKRNGRMDRIREILGSLPERMLDGIERLADLLLKLVNLPMDVYNRTDDTAARITRKLDDLDRKLKPFFSTEAGHVLGRMMSHLRYLWKGYRLRSVKGYVRFGTGSPDTTGELCGLIYLLLPVCADRYLVDPQFYEKIFRTDTDIKGVIRLYRLLVVAVRLLLDKEFRILIRKIRHR